jgi:hypothetical protein
MLKIIGAGIDTVQVELRGKFKEELQEIKTVIDDKTTYTDDNNTRIVVRANRELSSINEALACIELVAEKIKCKDWRITRVDMTVDYENRFEENMKLYRLFLECLAIVRRKDKLEIFNTKKGIEKQCNLKISSKRIETTIYNCIDKARISNTRLENKIKDIRNTSSDRDIIENEIKKFLEEIQDLELLVEKVEEKYIEELTRLHHETIEKKYRTFSEFVAFADSQNYILTSNVLKTVMKKVGIKTSYNSFRDMFKRTRKTSLEFTSKTELKNMINDVKKELKKVI